MGILHTAAHSLLTLPLLFVSQSTAAAGRSLTHMVDAWETAPAAEQLSCA